MSPARSGLRKLVFLATEEEAAQRPNRSSSRPLLALVALTLLALAWWFLVPPIVHRPSAPVWCPMALKGSPVTRFDARKVLGMSLNDGYELAAQHGCIVQDASGDQSDEGRTNRILVDVSRGTITRIDAIG